MKYRRKHVHFQLYNILITRL